LIRFVLFIAVVQTILFGGHWFFYRTLVYFFEVTNPPVFFILKSALGLLSISLVFTSLLSFRYANLLVRGLYMISVYWLGIFYILLLSAILCWVFYGLAKGLHLPCHRMGLIGILIGAALLVSLYGFINAGNTRITRVNIELPRLPDLWRGKTAVWVSDTHLGQVRNLGFARKIAGLITQFHPDIVFIGGDLYDGQAVDPDGVIEPFSRISAPYGAYFITGNHEEFGDNTSYLRAVRKAGMRVLNNEKVDLDGLQIIGVDFRDSRNEKQFKTLLEDMKIDRQKPSILLKHTPFHLEVAREQNISLQLSGHTHRGQVFLFRWITSRVYQGYDYGLKWFGDLMVYTSSGAGTWGPPMRIDTKPEIVVITLK
jgi:uncharacterized protein